MANNFKGYLLRCITLDTGGNRVYTVFPHEYIKVNTWTSTPDQREEIQAYRDDNTRALFRQTASGKKSVFGFKTRDDLHLADKQKIQKFFTDHEENAVERKIWLQFWNEETNNYDTGHFYRPNMEFPIKRITKDDIIYGEMQFDFVEY